MRLPLPVGDRSLRWMRASTASKLRDDRTLTPGGRLCTRITDTQATTEALVPDGSLTAFALLPDDVTTPGVGLFLLLLAMRGSTHAELLLSL